MKIINYKNNKYILGKDVITFFDSVSCLIENRDDRAMIKEAVKNVNDALLKKKE